MKKLFALMLMALTVLMATACLQKPLPERMDRFVTTVEQRADSYTQADWDAANEKFEALCEEYQQTKGSLTLDQIKQVRAAMGRYATVAIRSGVESVSSAIEDIGAQIPDLIQEIKGAVPGLLGSLDSLFRNLGESLDLSGSEAPAQ